jgi:hypothetical protein
MKLPKPDWRRFADIWRKFIADSRARISARRARISAAPPLSWRQFKADMREPTSVPRFFLNLGVPFVLLILFLAAAKYHDWITRHFSPGWLFVTILVASFGLFYVRRFCRLGYGILEFLLGVAIVGDTIFGPAPESSKLDESAIKACISPSEGSTIVCIGLPPGSEAPPRGSDGYFARNDHPRGCIPAHPSGCRIAPTYQPASRAPAAGCGASCCRTDEHPRSSA